jgi:hypothetical protein
MILDMFRFKLFVSLAFGSMFFVFFTIPTYVSADSNDIEILSHSVTSQFPDGLKFAVTAKSSTQIVEVAVRFKVGHRNPGYTSILNLYQAKMWKQAFSGTQILERNIYLQERI